MEDIVSDEPWMYIVSDETWGVAADIIKKRKLDLIEEQDLAARAGLPPIPDKLGLDATGEQIRQRRELMAARGRQQSKISKKSADAKRALEDDGNAASLK